MQIAFLHCISNDFRYASKPENGRPNIRFPVLPKKDIRPGVFVLLRRAASLVLAFQPQLADVARARLAAALDVILERDGLGADEAALEIRVDRARGGPTVKNVGMARLTV